MPYNILYCDPPWSYENKKTGGNMKSGAASQYDVLSVEELIGLRDLIKDVSDNNSVLFMWSVVPLLQEAFAVMESWGFKYKTMLTWHKTGAKGLGYYFRGETEHLLMGVRGRVSAFRCQERNHISMPRLNHSEKPALFRVLIETALSKALPTQRRLEIFGRQQTPGWTTIGYDMDGLDIKDSLQYLQNGGVIPEEVKIKEPELFHEILDR